MNEMEIQREAIIEIVGTQYEGRASNHNSLFYNLINNSSGKIFKLDYSSISKNSLVNIWDAVNKIYPDLSKVKYEPLIIEWAIKYGFVTPMVPETPASTDNIVKADKKTSQEDLIVPVPDTVVNEERGKTKAVFESAKSYSPEEKSVAGADKKAPDNIPEAVVSENAPSKKSSVQVLYERMKRDMDNGQGAIITSFTEMFTPLSKAYESIQGEINKSRELGMESAALKAKKEELERQLVELRTRL